MRENERGGERGERERVRVKEKVKNMKARV